MTFSLRDLGTHSPRDSCIRNKLETRRFEIAMNKPRSCSISSECGQSVGTFYGADFVTASKRRSKFIYAFSKMIATYQTSCPRHTR